MHDNKELKKLEYISDNCDEEKTSTKGDEEKDKKERKSKKGDEEKTSKKDASDDEDEARPNTTRRYSE